MKLGLLVPILVATTSVSAKITDLQYMPAKGAFFSKTEFSQEQGEIELSYFGKNVSKSEVDETNVNQTLLYTSTDSLSFGVGLSYNIKSETESKYGPGSTINGTIRNYESSGLRDIELVLKKRLRSEETIVDLSGVYSPKTGDAESASTSKKGNAFDGGSSVGATLEIGGSRGHIQYSGSLSIIHDTEREVRDLSNNTMTKYKSTTNVVVGAEIKVQTSEIFFLKGSLGVASLDDQNYREAGDTTDTVIERTIGVVGGAAAQYKLSESSVVDVGLFRSISDYNVYEGSTSIFGDYESTVFNIGFSIEI
ncbi:hypothetical protein [Bacteriovorax sp. Seq25_V]|uniref:hypothetical protein n=1 Tax=Bacteriovorax sp. Seq25_V TaxID=1201288 RepID=UPI000389DC37|nr:hypothetical protein [Bacteriovorax sp. Seq25_V]EQC45249.1 hypothetical protein M900_1950 [Bacteriovorax sp. Seq25_V]